MTKGQIKEIIDYAIFMGEEEILLYSVTYREFDKYITIPLKEFLAIDQEIAGVSERAVPLHRIVEIYKEGKMVFSRPRN